MKKIFYALALSFLVFFEVDAQTFSLDADIRPRFEYRHGFGAPLPDGADPAAFVTQRSRLNFAYQDSKLKVYFSVQDVSTWGDTRQLAINDENHSFSLFQAWLSYAFTENWSMKLGRQTLSYDDQRILGEVDWTMQGRFHDAAMLTFAKNGFKTDLAVAYSQENQKNEGTGFPITGLYTYKVMQMLHAKKTWDKASVSFLFLNNGFQKYTEGATPQPDGVYYRQTTGTYFTFPVSVFTLTGSAYLQTGKSAPTTDLTAYQYMLEARYKPGKVAFTLGFESLSGSDQVATEKTNSFFPLYGTNHKFNGYMDLFYVGNHANNVGLNDLYLTTLVPTGKNSSIGAFVHFFSAQAELNDGLSKNLGSELDLVYSKTIAKNIKLNVGYSQYFDTESMTVLKGGIAPAKTQNWGWAQLIVTPSLFKHSLKEE
ncbi:alginate export family protein [Algoriphagus terrigena]|uniref:alginate export family protein n=1 Tax=Algoriphagus terrigena TaxID=344884 RepID=UPI00041048B8|nr:alginate export family protein [Algoriphagus terrigena]